MSGFERGLQTTLSFQQASFWNLISAAFLEAPKLLIEIP